MTLERERKAQLVVNAFHRVFNSPEGQIVLKHLNETFRTGYTAFLPRERGLYDPIHAAIRDGQRSVMIRIDEYLRLKPAGDENISKPKTIVKK